MPKNKFQEVIFGIIMVIFMVYAMVCYNISLSLGGLSNKVFVMALSELPIMCPIAFILEMAFVGKISKKVAFDIINPQKDNPFFITIIISCVTVMLMCPLMSLVATLLFHNNSEIFSTWIKTATYNFPMALCWQLFYAGPIVRFIFKNIFKEKVIQNEVVSE